MEKLNNCVETLSGWGKKLKSHFRDDIGQCKKKLEELRECNDEEFVLLVAGLKQELATLSEQEDKFWRQRAKVHWLRDGDRSTKYFHVSTSERKKHNRLDKLSNNDGHVFDTQ